MFDEPTSNSLSERPPRGVFFATTVGGGVAIKILRGVARELSVVPHTYEAIVSALVTRQSNVGKEAWDSAVKPEMVFSGLYLLDEHAEDGKWKIEDHWLVNDLPVYLASIRSSQTFFTDVYVDTSALAQRIEALHVRGVRVVITPTMDALRSELTESISIVLLGNDLASSGFLS